MLKEIKMDTILSYQHINFYYNSQAVCILKDITFNVEKGEIISILGNSGSGKTTLIKLANRLLVPASGHILFKGEDISTMDTAILRRHMGYVIQQSGLFPHMSVAQNINIAARLNKEKTYASKERVTELLKLSRLPCDEEFRNRHPWQLSGGQQQRVSLARALCCDPEILLMDEPFGALDAITRLELQEELLQLQHQTKKTILFVTHDLKEALALGNRILIIKDGEIQQLATPEELTSHPANDYVCKLLKAGRG